MADVAQIGDSGICIGTSDAGALGSCSDGSLGASCLTNQQCQSGYCPNGFCWALPLEGDACDGSDVCGGGLVCNGTTCEPTVTQGPAACTYRGW